MKLSEIPNHNIILSVATKQKEYSDQRLHHRHQEKRKFIDAVQKVMISVKDFNQTKQLIYRMDLPQITTRLDVEKNTCFWWNSAKQIFNRDCRSTILQRDKFNPYCPEEMRVSRIRAKLIGGSLQQQKCTKKKFQAYKNFDQIIKKQRKRLPRLHKRLNRKKMHNEYSPWQTISNEDDL